MTKEQPTPDAIMQLGLAFWGSKALLSAVELGLFTTLAKGPRTGKALTAKLGLQPRGTTDWLDALVSLGMLERTVDEYANTAATDLFLDRAKPTYLGRILEMANARLYPFWGSLTEALRTGQPQNEAKAGQDFFQALYHDQARLKEFLHAMTGLSMGAARAITQRFLGIATTRSSTSAPPKGACRCSSPCATRISPAADLTFPPSDRCSRNALPRTGSPTGCTSIPETSSPTRSLAPTCW
jgi:hypothetical protein